MTHNSWSVGHIFEKHAAKGGWESCSFVGLIFLGFSGFGSFFFGFGWFLEGLDLIC